MMTDEEAAGLLEYRWCRAWFGDTCVCAANKCAGKGGDWEKRWGLFSKALNVPLPALAALATGSAVVVPRALTEAMEQAFDDEWRGAGSVIASWQLPWTAALAASPFAPKREPPDSPA